MGARDPFSNTASSAVLLRASAARSLRGDVSPPAFHSSASSRMASTRESKVLLKGFSSSFYGLSFVALSLPLPAANAASNSTDVSCVTFSVLRLSMGQLKLAKGEALSSRVTRALVFSRSLLAVTLLLREARLSHEPLSTELRSGRLRGAVLEGCGA